MSSTPRPPSITWAASQRFGLTELKATLLVLVANAGDGLTFDVDVRRIADQADLSMNATIVNLDLLCELGLISHDPYSPLSPQRRWRLNLDVEVTPADVDAALERGVAGALGQFGGAR